MKIKEIRIKYKNKKWLCDVVEEFETNYKENRSNKVLAVDLGLKTLATCVDNNGNVIVLHNKAKKINKYFTKQIAKVSSKISKKQDNSNKKEKLQETRRKLYHRKNAQVKQTLHIQSKKLVNMNYHTIVLGDLSVKELMQKKNNKKNIRKSFHQSAIDTFRQYLSYKCQGRTEIIEIDERYTTQLNCLTGKKFDKKIELKDREVKITEKIIIDRDLNSAINILKRWESYHLAELTPPLDITNVLNKQNLLREPPML